MLMRLISVVLLGLEVGEIRAAGYLDPLRA
jgi:hypothetical protein